jgi:ISXO2 transposase-like protein
MILEFERIGLSRRYFKSVFGSDEECLNHVMQIRKNTICYCSMGENCGPLYKVRKSTFRSRRCGRLLWPLAQTLFHRSNISLAVWFEALWLFSICRNGLTVNFTQRYFGISHVAAWRLLTRLRMHITLLREQTVLGLNDREVVIADTDVKSVRSSRSTRTTTGKVIGMSDGSDIFAFLIARRRPQAVSKVAELHLTQGTRVATLDFPIYQSLARSGGGLVVRRLSEYELRDNLAWKDLKGFWVHLKRTLAGTYKHFREENLIGYVKELEWRKAHHDQPDGGFGLLISEFPTMPSGTAPVISLIRS